MSGLSGGGGGVAAGTVVASAQGVQDGFLECNGAALSRTTYAALFLAIGTDYGVGDGSTTFDIPDLRGEFIRGLDNGRGVDSGRVNGSSQTDLFKAHTHTGGTQSGSTITSAAGFIYKRANTGSVGGSETRPRNVAMTYCIKY